MFAIIIQVYFFSSCFTVSSSLRTLSPRVDCTQQGLEYCRINNCSEKTKVQRKQDAPPGPEWGPELLGVAMDQQELMPILNVSWRIQATAGVLALCGSQISIQDKSTNQSICLQYFYNTKNKSLNPNYAKWTFSLDGVIVQPEHTYEVVVFNLPKPDSGDNRTKIITIPGCYDRKIQQAQECRENGSLWEPYMRTNSTLDWDHRVLFIVVSFYASDYSKKYQVSLRSPGVNSSFSVLAQENRLLNVTFELSLSQLQHCEIVIKIQPFFKQCNSGCWSPETTFDYCLYYSTRTLIIKTALGLVIAAVCLAYFTWRTFHPAPVNTLQSAVENIPLCIPTQKRKKLMMIYSLDHPLYKSIVLKLCAFLMAKCGIEVVLDLLDSTRLGMMGGIQWLDWHREQIESSSDKILILCSKGVQAKWRSMCSGKQVQLKEDAHSTVGDMLVPALCLMVPHFVQSVSFEKYIVAYFDDVSSEDDVPLPFNITVRYKLMKQFEELFFRILDSEKHELGRVNHIEGLSEDEYHHCPTGRALRDAIEAFHAYQLDHPHWFEEELLENVELGYDSDFVPHFECYANQIENDFTAEETILQIRERPCYPSITL